MTRPAAAGEAPVAPATRRVVRPPHLVEQAEIAYAALGAKALVWIETHDHIEVYDQEPYVSEAAGHILRRLDQHH